MAMSKAEPTPQDRRVQDALIMREHAIGMALAAERLLETLGYPVETVIISRAERRQLTRRGKNRNI